MTLVQFLFITSYWCTLCLGGEICSHSLKNTAQSVSLASADGSVYSVTSIVIDRFDRLLIYLTDLQLINLNK